MRTSAQLNQAARSEIPAADHIPFGSMVAPGVVRLRGNRGYLASWRLDGIAFETADADYIRERKEALHHFIRSLGGGKFALWTHKVRRAVRERLDGSYDNAFARQFNERYYASFDLCDTRSGEPLHRQMVTELYVSAIYRPTPSLPASLLRKMTVHTAHEIRERFESELAVMEDLDRQLLTSLRRYGPEPLGSYTRNGRVYSEMAAFLGFLVNGVWEDIPLMSGELAEYLPTSRLSFGDQNGLLEIWHPQERKFAGFLDFQDYPRRSEPGMNNAILYSDYEYIETQSFSMLNKHDALAALDRQKGHMVAAEDAAEFEIVEMDRAREQVSSGEIEMGEYHYTLTVFGTTLAEVARSMADARTALQDGPGFKVAVVDAIPECAWFAQLPGNWHMRPREASISSRNFTSLSPLHNFAQGKRSGNPWGEALALMQTPSGQPHYLNHHVSPEDHDAVDEKKPGNTVVIGQTGVGKTALVCGLMLFALKYAGLRGVFFDYNRGAEICIRRLGGRYSALKRGEPTGLNLCQLPLTEANIAFCEQLVRLLAGPASAECAAAEDAEIGHAVRTVMSDAIPFQLRRLSAVWQNLKVSPGGNSLRDRLQKWIGNGALGWAFDNPLHTHDFSDPAVQIYGYDYTEFLEDGELCTPTVATLLHMTESLIDGRPFIYWMEEFWKALSNAYFSKFAHDKQKTIRKLNGLGVFITQSPSDALTHAIGKTIVEQSVTQIYLPNPSADHDDYVNGFKVTEQEFNIIRNLGEDSRLFLLKQGHRSAILRFDLSSMPDILNILSGSLDNVELLDAIRSAVGDDPEVWEPILQDRIATRRKAIRHI
jgi:type IV secretion system protein VirB4